MKLYQCTAVTTDGHDPVDVICAKDEREALDKFRAGLDDEGVNYHGVFAQEVQVKGYKIILEEE